MHSSVPERIRPAIPVPAIAVVLALIATLVPIASPTTVTATGSLANGSVSPGSGTTSTVFTFSIEYSSSPNHEPADIWVDVGGTVIPLQFSGVGTPEDGTYQESSTLPAGTHAVTFSATGLGQDPTLDVGTVTVTPGPTPPPTPLPTPGPTPPPTPLPTPGPTPPPTPVPTPPPPGVTPRPTPRATPLPPGATPTPATASPEASSAETEDEPADSSGPSASADASAQSSESPSGSSTPEATGSPGASAEPDDVGESAGMGRLGLIVLGGMTSVAGAFVLARQWWIKRRA
jgi:hypothetical protein